jgi:hypothetical protein
MPALMATVPTCRHGRRGGYQSQKGRVFCSGFIQLDAVIGGHHANLQGAGGVGWGGVGGCWGGGI